MSKNTTTKCEYTPNPDIAGLGVVVPLLVNAVITMATSILYCVFRNTRQLKPPSTSPIRRALMGLIFGLSLQQLVSGIALAVAVGTSPFWGIPNDQGLDPHLLLATIMDTLAVQTGVMTTGIILWDERPIHVTMLRGGMCLALAFITFLQNWNVYGAMGHDESGIAAAITWIQTFAFLHLVSYPIIRIIAVLVIALRYYLRENRDERRDSGRAEHNERRNSERFSRGLAILMSFTAPIVSLISFVAVIVIKFGPSIVNCNLNDSAENVLSFGQITSIALLVAPPLTVIDAIYFAKNNDEAQGRNEPSELQTLNGLQQERPETLRA